MAARSDVEALPPATSRRQFKRLLTKSPGSARKYRIERRNPTRQERLMKIATRTTIGLGIASSMFAAACSFAGTASVSGSFNSNDSKYGNHPYAVKVASGCAFRDKARFDDKQVTVVVLSDKPVDAAAIANSADRRAALREQMDVAKANYVEWEVSEGNTSPTLYE